MAESDQLQPLTMMRDDRHFVGASQLMLAKTNVGVTAERSTSASPIQSKIIRFALLTVVPDGCGLGEGGFQFVFVQNLGRRNLR